MRGQRGIFCHCEELIKFYAIVSPRNNRNKKTTNTIEGGDLLRKFFLMVVERAINHETHKNIIKKTKYQPKIINYSYRNLINNCF